jgi:hypothetical protein
MRLRLKKEEDMSDYLLMYRSCGAECRDDYLRGVAHDNGLPLSQVQRLADQLGQQEDFGTLVQLCEEQGGLLQ